ncbi:hypothetical protein [Streptomyces sp. NPDC058011]|uniref:hypothetical protein n=1 Tax=Streptomyces sp. NPDC058011 TaxID=3346305 RepID=UPI0036EBD37B
MRSCARSSSRAGRTALSPWRRGQAFGYVLYGTTLAAAGDGVLRLAQTRDRAQVVVDGQPVGTLERERLKKWEKAVGLAFFPPPPTAGRPDGARAVGGCRVLRDSPYLAHGGELYRVEAVAGFILLVPWAKAARDHDREPGAQRPSPARLLPLLNVEPRSSR